MESAPRDQSNPQQESTAEAQDEDGTSSSSDGPMSDSFAEWYRERQYRQNIENGNPYFNGPDTVQPPDRHSPSRLLQCHRKSRYARENAPEENGDPDGIFWIGSRFEEELALPFLRDVVAGSDQYVTNSLWVDFTVDTSAGQLRIKGETDPAIVDEDGVPHLLTEIKTKQSVDSLDAPNEHHKAQAHAYMHGLSEKYDREVTKTLFLYAARTTFEVKTFQIEFDPTFWNERVLAWAETQTEYLIEDALPPAEPEQSWECKFCDYRNRCGKGRSEFSDYGPKGFLPGFTDYPRENVVEYLEAHPTASLTPALARTFPELAEEYSVMGWYCRECESTIDWEAVGEASEPLCPRCAQNDEFSTLTVEPTAEQETVRETVSEEKEQ